MTPFTCSIGTARQASASSPPLTAFTHGVASGDPDVDRIVLWTRVAPASEPVALTWRIANDPDLMDVVSAGSATADASSDWTSQVDVSGLQSGRRYWYGFLSGDEASPVGTFKTLPSSPHHLRFAVVSCAKFNAGFFNGYARIAERDDLDFVLHLGDYIYEASQVPPASQTPGADIGRPFEPFHECKTLDDYRTRYAQYRADPDTQSMHRAHALLCTMDDHELADGAWRGGSDEHKPERDGPWETRRASAFQARREWLPARLPDPHQPDRVFRTVRLGGLADLFLIDTRSRRDQPVAGPAMDDPNWSQLGSEQRDWLFNDLDGSQAAWRILANSSVLSHTWAVGINDELRPHLRSLKLISADGGPDPDQWDGYPAERDALLGHLEDRDVVVLSGDIHVAMALQLERPNRPGDPLAAEFVTPSLTSQNLDDKAGWGYRTKSVDAERELMELLPNLRFADMDSHGYMIVDVTRERVRVEWWFVETVLERTSGQRLGAAFEIRAGSQSIVRLD